MGNRANMLRRVALTIAVCTCLLNWASLAAYHEMAPPSWLPVVDEWTEAAEDPVAGGDLDGLSPWEEEEDKDIKHEMETPAVDTEDEDEDPNDVDTGDEDEVTTAEMFLSTKKNKCRAPCIDPKRYGNEPWSKRCTRNICKKSCDECKGGAAKPPTTPAKPSKPVDSGNPNQDGDGSVVTLKPSTSTSTAGGKAPPTKWGKKLAWNDEFDFLDTKKWGFEEGFVRNEEHQWFQKENAKCTRGNLVITAEKHAPGTKRNPNHDPKGKDYKTKRQHIAYTSSALQTKGKYAFGLGMFELRAKVDVREGAWPAWWTLGENIDQDAWSWPRCGEIDMMEVFGKSPWERGPVNKGNVIYGTSGWWDYAKHRYVQGKDMRTTKKIYVDTKWGSQWHVFRMDRKAKSITLYVDDRVINHFDFSRDKMALETFAPDKKIFMIINLALGGCCGGNPDKTMRDNSNKNPFKFEVDYVRVYTDNGKI